MRIGIYGYGNLGRGVEIAAKKQCEAELVGVFTRRNADSVTPIYSETNVYPADAVYKFKEKIDVLIITSGSATDLPEMTPRLAEHFNVIDSFDTHAKISEHFKNTDFSAKKGGNIALISAGWDPGLFSLIRLYSEVFLPYGNTYTFWGKGVSQGHSDAIRRIDGVIDARQYTMPINEALDSVRCGEIRKFLPCEMHKRECFVLADKNADKEKIENEIKTIPNYFLGYDTSVNFITEEELLKNHSKLYHGGNVIRIGRTGVKNESFHKIELLLTLDSNPEFTGSILVAYAGAILRMKDDGVKGCKTVLDIPPSYLISEAEKEKYINLL